MNFSDYKAVTEKFNGILKNPPLDAQAFKTHFYLVSEKIKDVEIFKESFKRHVDGSDFFPSHLDLIKNAVRIEFEKLINFKRTDTYELEKQKLFKLIEDKNYEFISNKDPLKVDILRKELHELIARGESLN